MGLLWFRRRGKSSKPAQESDSPFTLGASTPRQAQAPLVIRGLMFVNLRPTDGPAELEKAPPLGSRDSVIRTLGNTLPGITFAGNEGVLASRDHRVSIDLGPHDPVHAIVVSAEGSEGIDLLRTLLQRAGWRAYKPRDGVFIEPDTLDLFALPMKDSVIPHP